MSEHVLLDQDKASKVVKEILENKLETHCSLNFSA